VTVFLLKPDARVILKARAEGPGAVGDLVIELWPGESAFGRTYYDWRALPEGPHEVD
jgi:hypothetical protein